MLYVGCAVLQYSGVKGRVLEQLTVAVLVKLPISNKSYSALPFIKILIVIIIIIKKIISSN